MACLADVHLSRPMGISLDMLPDSDNLLKWSTCRAAASVPSPCVSGDGSIIISSSCRIVSERTEMCRGERRNGQNGTYLSRVNTVLLSPADMYPTNPSRNAQYQFDELEMYVIRQNTRLSAVG